MTALIVGACIVMYFGIGAFLHPKFALAQYNASQKTMYDKLSAPRAAKSAVGQAIVWPIYFLIWRSAGLINKDIELQKEMKKVREQIEEQRRIERQRAQKELDAFDRAMKEGQ